MAVLYGKPYGKADLLRRVGSLAQVAGVREYRYTSGRADGVRAIEVTTGDFRFELLPSRCLDVAGAWYRGIPLGYHSKSGLRHPAYFRRSEEHGFNDNFLGGVLTTCGLHSIGPGRVVAGRAAPDHGDIANIPADSVSIDERWDGDRCLFSIGAVVRHGNFYGGDLILRRRVTAALGESWFRLEDEVENLDFAPAPCVLLYHCQCGFPVLDAASRLVLPRLAESRSRRGDPVESDGCTVFGAPVDGAEETVVYHRVTPDADGWAGACLFNPELGADGIGMVVRWDTATLPLLVQWKMLRSREYVCGLEPAAAALDTRSDEEMAALTLRPLESRRFCLEIGVLEGRDRLREWANGELNHG